VQAERAPTFPATGVDEVRGARTRGAVRGHLLLWRSGVRVLSLLARRAQHAGVLLHRLGRPGRLPATLLVPQAGGGSERARGYARGDTESWFMNSSGCRPVAGTPNSRRVFPPCQ